MHLYGGSEWKVEILTDGDMLEVTKEVLNINKEDKTNPHYSRDSFSSASISLSKTL